MTHWHCGHCGYEYEGGQYDFHPKYCPVCRHSKDWQDGKTANRQKCDIYSMCHEPMKGACPEWCKTCAYFKEISIQAKETKQHFIGWKPC